MQDEIAKKLWRRNVYKQEEEEKKENWEL